MEVEWFEEIDVDSQDFDAAYQAKLIDFVSE
jgi:hypothetical protein